MKPYEYVIIGAGSAGCVLASRLTEDPNVTVLVLEAGGSDKRQEIAIPAAFPKLFKSSCDWSYHTEPQPGLNNRRLFWPRGKVLGGSSSINAMIYSRASNFDHDHWGELGNKGWCFKEALQYYKKAENQERGASEYHGVGGPLNVADLRCVNPLSRAFVEAGIEAGLPQNNDFNGPIQDGVGLFQVTQKNGARQSNAAAYLKPVLKRPNLKVSTGVHATQLLFEKRRVVGVAFNESSQQNRVFAREVILCGGAVNSPQLLMVSGIGPADDLRSLGISVVADLPGVGRNLQDHLMVVICYESLKPITLAGAESFRNIAGYLLLKKGALTSNIGEAGAFIRTQSGIPKPDIELIFAPAYFLSHGFSNPVGHGFSIGVALERPESVGRINLRSGNPLHAPMIQPDYLSTTSDLKVLVEGIAIARAIAQTRTFAEFRGKELSSDYRDNEAVADFIRQSAETLYHPVGTCRMGEDELSVVDPQLRVRGIEGLRVVDASVFPEQITGHTNAPVVMIAEKAANMIKHAESVNTV